MNTRRDTRFLTCFLTLALLLALIASSTAQVNNIVISVDATEVLAEINPFVLSVNHSPGGISLDVAEEAHAIDFNFVRFPHGNWGDLNDLTPFHIDLFMVEVTAWETTPSINIRLKDSTPEQAAHLVRYVNIENDYDVRFWYIGNEPNLYDDYDVETYVADWRAFALAMLEVDPDILLIGPELSQFPDTVDGSDFYSDLNDVWLRRFLEVNGDLVDIVAVHRYPFPSSIGYDSATTIQEMRENVPRWSTVVENMRRTIADVLGERASEKLIGITEANSHWTTSGGGIATPDSHYNAIWWSGVLSTLIQQDVDIVSYFMLYTVGTNGSYGILDRYEPRPTYYTYVLFSEFGEQRVATSSSDEYVTAVAANRADGATTLIITNLYEEDVTIDLERVGLDDRNIEMRLLTPDLMAERVSPADYLLGNTLAMPAQSVALLVFD